MNSSIRFPVALFSLLLTLILALVAPLKPARATSFVSRPLSETTQKTPTIVRGKIGSSYADWSKNPDGSKRIYTYYELQPTEVFKGEPKVGTTFQIRELGGEKDGVGLQIAGAAQFTTGEDVVVMLGEKNPDGSYDIQGLMSGKFAIGHDSSGNETLIGATGDEDQGASEDNTPPHGPWTLDEFRKLIASQNAASPGSSVNAQTKPAQSNTAANAAPAPASSAAPQLQPDAAQGAAQSSQSLRTGYAWMIAAVLILLLGGWLVGRKIK